MSRSRSRTLLAAILCAIGVAVLDGSVAAASAPPDDTATESTESDGPPSTGATVTDTSDAIATATGGGVEILPPDESWAGATRGEWDAQWWQWAVSMPDDINPNFDSSGGERCGYGQSGPVFFVPVSFTGEPLEPGYTCVVAEGTAVYVPAVGVECSTVEPPPFFGRDEEELRACATAATEGLTDFSASVNGEDVGDLEGYRTSSPLFTLTFPEDNVFDVEPGVAQAVSEVYSFIIAPPPPGEYELTVSTRFAGEPGPFVITITIVVEAPQVIEAQEPDAPGSSGPGSTGPGSSAPVDTRPGANVQRYCAIVEGLDEAGSDFFAELEADESATDEDFAEAERQFIEAHQAEFDELRRVAPDEIADDVDVLLAAQEQRAAGGEQQEVSPEVAAAEERVLAFEDEHCARSE